ncbi:TrkA C-terminal domain-containing protein [Desulfobacterota bacterium AH_259_B03_O07]|nr:TrkA C-terminal domain-containing protein [Desulfobacterota bacterium AH_259_B03_O07]
MKSEIKKSLNLSYLLLSKLLGGSANFIPFPSKFVGQTLDESGIGRDLGIIIVAIKSKEGVMQFSPTSKTIIKEGDILIAMGEVSKLGVLEEAASVS